MGCAKSKPDNEVHQAKSDPPAEVAPPVQHEPSKQEVESEEPNEKPEEQKVESKKPDSPKEAEKKENPEGFKFELGTHQMDETSFYTGIIINESDPSTRQMVITFLELPVAVDQTIEEFDNRCDELSMPNTKLLQMAYKNVASPRRSLQIARLKAQFGVETKLSDLLTPSAQLMERYLVVLGSSPEHCEMAINNLIHQASKQFRLGVRTSGDMIWQNYHIPLGDPSQQLWLATEEALTRYTHEYNMLASGSVYKQIKRYQRAYATASMRECSTKASDLQPIYIH